MTTTRPADPARPSRRRAGRRDRRGELARGAAAIGLLVLLVAGLPVLLRRTGGSPLPGGMPSLTGVGDWLLQPDSGELLLSTLFGLAWLGWAWFTLAVIAETTAQLRGQPLPRLRGFSAPQQLAARLVAVAALVVATPPVATFATAPAPVTLVATELPATKTPSPPPIAREQPPATPPVVAARATPSKVYEVQPPRHDRRDSLWAIAERHLGDPLRWTEIAKLNHGRLQPDGHRLTDPHWIRPGWLLAMPSDATGLPALTPPPARHDTAATDKPAHPTSPPLPPPADEVTPNLAPPAPAEGAGRSPAQNIGPRQAPSAAPPRERAPETDRRTTRRSDRDRPEIARQERDQRDTAEQALPFGALVAGGGLLAAGLVAALAQARTRARRRRPTGARVPRPTPGLAAAEVRLRVLAEPDDRDFLDLALRSLSLLTARRRDHETPGAALPELLVARLTASALELHLAQPAADPPLPYTANVDGRIWTVDKESLLPLDRATARSVLAPYPGLVPVGYDDTALVLVDLEGAGSIAIGGDPDHARGLLAWICAELAVGSWSDYLAATAVGLPASLSGLASDRLQIVARLDVDVLQQFAKRPAQRVLESRLGDGTDPAMPEFLLLSEPPTSATADALDTLMRRRGRTGVGVVVTGEYPAANWHLSINPAGHLTLPVPGLPVTANRLDDQTAEVMTGLLVTADVPLRPETPTHEPPRATAKTSATHPETRQLPPERAADDPAADDLDAAVSAYLDVNRTDVARIEIMGPVRVRAAGPVFTNRASVCTELIAYLAAHPRGVDEPAKLDLALWPDRAVLTTTRNEVIARARKWLGHDANGDLHLPHRRDGSPLRLRPGVLVDWHLFQGLARRGLAAGAHGTQDLALALALVRGKPFENVPGTRYAWVAETFLEQDIPTLVVDVAHTQARHRLAAGDPAAARGAARSGQRVDQYDERLWRDLLLAEHRLGNSHALRVLAANLATVLETDLGEDLEPETSDLIRHLLPRSQAS